MAKRECKISLPFLCPKFPCQSLLPAPRATQRKRAPPLTPPCPNRTVPMRTVPTRFAVNHGI